MKHHVLREEHGKLERKAASGIMLTLLLTSMFTLVLPASGSVSGIELKYRTPYSLPKGLIYVLVEPSLFDGIEFSLKRYATDLESIDGFSVGIYTVSTTDTAAIKSFLQQALSEGLVGCLLVGDVAQAYYEWLDWEGTYFRVPTDFYYMDLDGVWSDTDDDGIYDKHGGEVGAEIWLGSLKPSLISGDKFQLLNNYFEKNHLYRTGKIAVLNRALAYHDDYTWNPLWMEEWVNNTIKVAYNETVLVNDPEMTIASDYLQRLREGYEWIFLVAHGWPGSHTFWHQGWWDGTVYGSDYRLIDPPTIFYVLSICYAASGYNNVAGSCVFTDTYGLLAFGSRGAAWKPGPGIVGYPTDFPWNWHRTEFYTVLSEGKCIGEAYLEDMKFYESMIIANPEYEIPGYEYLWTIAGDPSLHINGYPWPSHDLGITAVTTSKTVVGQGYNVSIDVMVFNYSNNTETFNTIIYANTTAIATMNNIDLAGRESTNLTFMWNTVGLAEGNYTISAYAIPVPDETDTSDNILIGGIVTVTVPGDLNGDFTVNYNDVSLFAPSYGANPTKPYWNPNADLNGDNKINYKDLYILATNYGKTNP